jgi:hypothetical protein
LQNTQLAKGEKHAKNTRTDTSLGSHNPMVQGYCTEITLRHGSKARRRCLRKMPCEYSPSKF